MKIILLPFFLLLNLLLYGQEHATLTLGTGAVWTQGNFGIGYRNEIAFPLVKNFTYGVHLGHIMASDRQVDLTRPGPFDQTSIFFSDLSLAYSPVIASTIRFSAHASGGVRHVNGVAILVNSSGEVQTPNNHMWGFGLQAGVSADYLITDKYFIGLQYLHDFYMDGFDYLGLRVGLEFR